MWMRTIHVSLLIGDLPVVEQIYALVSMYGSFLRRKLMGPVSEAEFGINAVGR